MNVARRTYNTNSQIKFKTTMLKSYLCDYSDVSKLVKGRITVAAHTAVTPDRINEQVITKGGAPFTDCISEINNTKEDNTKNIDVLKNHSETLEKIYGNVEKKNEITLSQVQSFLNLN